MKNKQFQAVVTDLKGTGEKSYVVTRLHTTPSPGSLLDSNSVVTFSLSVWQGDSRPKRGQVVLLDDVEKFARGWRAQSASPIRA